MSDTRAAALLAAASWLPPTDGEAALYETAERFAEWIDSTGEAPKEPQEPNREPAGTTTQEKP